MKVDKRRIRSYWAAALLSAVTLFTFYTFRDYGPASAVRRFHEDVLTNNFPDLQKVSSEPIRNPDVLRLAIFLRNIEESGAQPKLARQERSQDEVSVLVLYQLNGGSQPFVWVVNRQPATWQVNVAETIRANPGLNNG